MLESLSLALNQQGPKELNAIAVLSMRKQALSQLSLRREPNLGWHFDYGLVRSKQRTQLNMPRLFLIHRNCEIINVLCFNCYVVVIHYMAKGN